MTVTEAAAALGLTPQAIRKRIAVGQMQAERAGARILLIPAAEVERWRVLGRQSPGPKARTPR